MLHFIISTSFVVDCLMVSIGAVANQTEFSLSLICYNGLSYLAWSVHLTLLVRDMSNMHWIQYVFWTTSVLVETFVGVSWIINFLKYEPDMTLDFYGYAQCILFSIRYLSELALFFLSFVRFVNPGPVEDSETTSLLSTSQSVYTENGRTAIKTVHVKKTRKRTGISAVTRFSLVLWPHDDLKLQFFAFLSILLMISGLAVNIWLPYKIGQLADDDMKEDQFAWISITIYVGLCYLQGEIGLFHCLQRLFWAPVDAYARRQASEYIHTLSRHDVQGSAKAAVDMLNQIIFQIIPLIANVILASVFSALVFSPIFGAILLLTVIPYMFATALLTQRYDRTTLESLVKIRIAQNTILTTGSLVGSLLFAYKVSLGELTSGGYVTYNMLLMQLCIPLHRFGKSYDTVHHCLSRLIRITESLETSEFIQYIDHESIVFDHVSYVNDAHEVILQDVSFILLQGHSLAIVGLSGSGKTTLLNLILGTIQPTSGVIRRGNETLGVVFQKTHFIQSSVRDNITYDQEASSTQIKQAARKVNLDNKIESMHLGYYTPIDSLSHENKQRVAIARAILTNPSLLLLDEPGLKGDFLCQISNTSLVLCQSLKNTGGARRILRIENGIIEDSNPMFPIRKISESDILESIEFDKDFAVQKPKAQKKLPQEIEIEHDQEDHIEHHVLTPTEENEIEHDEDIYTTALIEKHGEKIEEMNKRLEEHVEIEHEDDTHSIHHVTASTEEIEIEHDEDTHSLDHIATKTEEIEIEHDEDTHSIHHIRALAEEIEIEHDEDTHSVHHVRALAEEIEIEHEETNLRLQEHLEIEHDEDTHTVHHVRALAEEIEIEHDEDIHVFHHLITTTEEIEIEHD
ncbi:hypothetical protein CU098_010926 [Rhizopus stolonifer]|uniref:ABC transporter domain-containing protein n=1 Tax=Rhizopus stolonifer TaxID=4846 RepID=A0A367KR17_RHIST|nr:hypothetical protein CU098_010926 [Rhizopus stolonifer]